ncbi:MAG: ABC transporter ATP-binding protein [Solirubrobacterales bacterium]
MTAAGPRSSPLPLELEHVEVGYDRGGHRIPLVEDVDLTVAPGQSVAIVGESGSGKSLTVRATLGLLAPGLGANGSFRYGSEELDPEGRKRVRGTDIALILQDPFTMLNPLLSVLAHFEEMVRVHGGAADDARPRARALLAEVGIDDAGVLDRFPHELSGGMRQRVALALSLVADPGVLIADEVTTGLDTVTQSSVLRLFDKLRAERQMSLVMITHDLRLGLSHCDRVVVLYAGHVLEVAPTAELERRPCHPYTLGLMLSEPPADRRLPELVSIPGRVPRAVDVVEGCAFRDRCDFAAPGCGVGKIRPAVVAPDSDRLSACIRLPQISAEMNVRRQAFLATAADSGAAAAARPAPLIRIRELEKSFPARRGRRRERNLVVRGVSLELGRGECVGLVGSSGSGKSTIARCLVGLEDFDAGAIEFDDVRLGPGGRTPAERQALRLQTQMVFQDPYSTLNPALTVGRTLIEALRCARTPPADLRDAAAELLERVGLRPAYLGVRPSGLSGGERQRVAIARALALSPSVLVCDEPVSALDVSIQAQILKLIRELTDAGDAGCLLITHDLAVVRQVATWVYVLSEGLVVESGPADSVLDHPRHAYTRELIAAVPEATIAAAR